MKKADGSSGYTSKSSRNIFLVRQHSPAPGRGNMSWPATWERKTSSVHRGSQLCEKEHLYEASPGRTNSLLKGDGHCYKADGGATHAAQLNFAFWQLTSPISTALHSSPCSEQALVVCSPLCFHFIKCSHLQREVIFLLLRNKGCLAVTQY